MSIIAKYKFNQTTYANFIPTFNSDFTDYTITDEIDTDGYTIRTISNDSGNLPTQISFNGVGNASLLSVYECDTSEVTNMSQMFNACSSLTSINLSSWNTGQCTDMSNMFYNCEKLTSLDLSNFNTENVTSMSYMFYNCFKLTSLDLSSFNTENVTKMYGMFYNCEKLTSLDLSSFNTEKVTDATSMFDGLTSDQKVYITSKWTLGTDFPPTFITTFANIIAKYKFNQNTYESFIPTFNEDFTDYTYNDEIDTDGFTIRTLGNDSGVLPTMMRFGATFNTSTEREKSLLEVLKCNTDNLTDMNTMFKYCINLTFINISSFNTQNVTDMAGMFRACSSLTSLDLSNLNTNQVAKTGSMFYDCSNLTSLNLSGFNTENVTNMYAMFCNCSNLTSLDLSSFNTENVENMSDMFKGCSNLTSLNLSSFNTENVTNMNNMFHSCSKLTSLDLSNFNTQSNVANKSSMFNGWTSAQTVYVEPPYWSLGTTSLNSDINWVVNVTHSNGYWLDMTGITGATTITLANENNLPTEEITTDWGDGTQNSELTHTYSTAGKYVIVSNLQNAKSSGNLKDYITKMTVYYASTPANLCFNYNKITEVTLTNNWAEKTIEKYGQKISMTQMFRNCPLLELPNLELIKQFKPTYCIGMFYNCQKFTSIDLTGWDLSNCTSLEMMFNGCTNLTEIKGIENLNVSKSISFNSLFAACSSLTSLDLSSWDTSSCTDMAGMFKNCTLLTDVSFINEWNLSKVISFNALCHGAKALTSFTLDGKDLSSLNNCNYMLAGNQNLQTIKLTNLTTQKTINMSSMFENDSGLISVDFSGTIIKPNNTSLTFRNCSSLPSLDLSSWDTSQCINMGNMFANCDGLTELDISNFTTESLVDCANLFYDCLNLDVIDMSNFNYETNMKFTNMFHWASKCSVLGLIYCDAKTINKIVEVYRVSKTIPVTIYYHDADPSQLIPVEGVTFKKYQVRTTIQLPPHIQLHSLPDGTRDEVDIKTGILTRNVGCVVLDGSEDWKDGINNTNTFRMALLNFGAKENGSSMSPNQIKIDSSITDYEHIGIDGDGNVRLLLSKEKLSDATTDGFKSYLSKNPITLYYALVESTTERLILNYNNSCDYGRILPTGMCDRYSVVDSMYTQTMTSILLDGANTWDAMEEFENTVKFTATGTTVGVENLNMLGAGGLYCDNDLFPNINDDSDVPHCRVDEAGNKFYIYVDKEMLMSPDLIGWQIWLQENPFNLIYELAEHLTYVKPYEELDPTQARWEGMDCMRDGAISYHTNSSDNITMYPTLEYVAPSINNFEVTMLEPNTDYTIYAEGINTNDTINLGGTDINFNNGTVYTSGDNQWLRIDNNDSFYNMVITKGDTTGEVVPYFEGMTSIENPKVIVPTKNLATIKTEPYSAKDVNVEVIDGIINLSGASTTSYLTWDLNTGKTIQATFGAPNEKTYEYFSDKRIEGITPNTYTVTMRFSENSNPSELTGYVISIFVIYDDTKVVNRSLFISSNNNIRDYFDTITVNSHINGFAMQRWYTGDCTDVTASIQIEKGNVGTKFAPAGGSTVSYTDLKLRSLPNGVKDTINVVTGEYVQRVGEMLLNGNESWEHRGTSNGFTTLRSGTLKNAANKKSEIKIISNRFVGIPDSGSDSCQFEYVTRPDNSVMSIKVRILTSRLKEASEKGFREWLSENPMTVQYELAEPIITKFDPQTLSAYTDGTINLSSDTGLLPTTHYTVPSTNTFHLPSMKTGTRYTLKYPSASGSITIGDINYSISSDSMLFTTPLKINGDTSAIIFSDANPENVILLEGAYNKREVPFFTGVKSVKNPNITIIDQLSTESTTYNCETEIELRGLPNGVADKLDIIKGKLTTNVGIRPYQEGDENLSNIWTDGYETVYALSSPVVTNVTIDHPTVTTNSLIELSSDYLIPQLNYRAPSSNNFPLDLLQSNTTYTLYADTLTSGSYTLGGTRTGVYSQPHTITLGDMTDNLLTFNGDLGLSNVMLVKGNSLKTTLPPYFLGIRSVTDGHLLVEGMAGEMNEITFDEGIVLRDCNGVKDTIDLITCTLTKRTGEITLTGAEGWYRADDESTTDHNVFKLTLGGLKEALVLCDTLQSVFDTKMIDCIHAHTNELCIVIANATIGGDTVNALKAWLNQHPTTVVYQLRTPIEVQLENTWTTLPPTSYDNQTEITSTVSSNSLKPMISVTIATTTLEEIVSDLEAQNAQLEEENVATMLALTEVYEMMYTSTVDADAEPASATTWSRRIIVSSIGMVYAKLVKRGVKSIEEIPTRLQVEVQYAIDNGLV